MPEKQANEKKINSSRARSMEKITSATLALVCKKGFSHVTVTEICEAAGVVRKTFYRSYESKEDVIRSRLDDMYYELAAKYDFAEEGSSSMLTYVYGYLFDHRDFSSLFLDPDLFDIIINKMLEYIEHAYDETLLSAASFEPALADYYNTFIAVGMMSIIANWVRGGYKHSVKAMVLLTKRLLSGILT